METFSTPAPQALPNNGKAPSSPCQPRLTVITPPPVTHVLGWAMEMPGSALLDEAVGSRAGFPGGIGCAEARFPLGDGGRNSSSPGRRLLQGTS